MTQDSLEEKKKKTKGEKLQDAIVQAAKEGASKAKSNLKDKAKGVISDAPQKGIDWIKKWAADKIKNA